MEKETKKKNVFEDSILNLMFKESPNRLKGHFWTAVLAKVLYYLPFFVLAILPVVLYDQVDKLWIASLLIAFVLIGPMQYAYVRFFNKLTNGEKPSVMSIFKWRGEKFLLALVIGTVMSTAYLLGTILFVIPALILISMFSMVMFFVDKYEYNNVGEALIDCKVRMTDKGVSMLFYKLFFWFLFGVLTVAGVVLASSVQDLAVPSGAMVAVAIVGALVLLLLFSLVSAWYHACNQIYFEETLNYAEYRANRREQQAKFEESLNGKAKVENVKVEEVKVKEPAKKAPAKTTAAKATTTKTTATKAAATKTTAAKTTAAKKPAAAKPKTTTKK